MEAGSTFIGLSTQEWQGSVLLIVEDAKEPGPEHEVEYVLLSGKQLENFLLRPLDKLERLLATHWLKAEPVGGQIRSQPKPQHTNVFFPNVPRVSHVAQEKLGGRFSRNARVPSFLSGVSHSSPNSSDSRARPSARGLSRPVRIARSAAWVASRPLAVIMPASFGGVSRTSSGGTSRFPSPQVTAC